MKHSINSKAINSDAVKLIKLFNQENKEAYLVGGCVRDLIWGLKPHDFDICTNAKADETLEILKKNNIKFHTLGIKFGTVVAMLGGQEYEITTYRKESDYSDGRHPNIVEYTPELTEDLSRRDFTMNAIAYNPVTKELKDPFNGLKDMQESRLRAVGNPNERFKEDALRILRALRFAIKYNLDIEDSTFKAMISNKNGLDTISKERITSELEKMLTCGKPISKWFIQGHEIIFQIIPELRPCYKFKQCSKWHKHDVYEHLLAVTDGCDSADFVIKLTGLLHDIGKPNKFSLDADGNGHFYGHPEESYSICADMLSKRLKLSTLQREQVLTLVREHDCEIALNTRVIKRMLSRIGSENFDKLLIVKKSDRADHVFLKGSKYDLDFEAIKQLKDEVIASEQCFKITDLAINGKDIMNVLKIKPSKEIGLILHALLNEVLDEKIENNHDILIARAIELNDKHFN